MPSEPDYSAPEWATLRELPFIVILGAIVADEDISGWQIPKETAVAAQQLISDAKGALDNPLILHVVSEMSNEGISSGNREVDLDDEGARSSALKSALAASAVAAALLNRAPADQAQAYKQWVLNAAIAATRAVKTGGILGIGDKEISDGESEFLNKLESSLGLAGAE